jgi:hypothetical protein
VPFSEIENCAPGFSHCPPVPYKAAWPVYSEMEKREREL